MRHGAEFARAIRAGEWERNAEGIYFPRQGALLVGEYQVVSKYGNRRHRNLVTDWGLDLVVQMALGTGMTSANYLGLYQLSSSPTPLWNEYSLWFASELGGAPEGYSEGALQDWLMVDEGAGFVGNTASPATFTMVTSSTIDVNGFFMLGAASNVKRQGFPPLGTTPDLTLMDVYDPGFVPGGFAMPYGTIRGGFNNATDGSLVWLDPTNSDYYDGTAGYWIDPIGDSRTLFSDGVFGVVSDVVLDSLFQAIYGTPYPSATTVLSSVAQLTTAPETFNNGDLLNLTYKLSFL